MKLFTVLFIFLMVVFFIMWYQNHSTKNIQPGTTEIKNIGSPGSIDTIPGKSSIIDSNIKVPPIKMVTHKKKIDSLIQFAKSLIGTPYTYASTDPSKGFDCSGFINYIFNHFNIKVPRSSRDFRNVGKEIELKNSRPGDLILFTGTNPEEREIGHIGLIISNKDGISFIHSSSGKANGVVVTDLNDYYRSRFVKVERVFFTK